MAMNLAGMTDEEINDFYNKQNQAKAAFGEWIKDPANQAIYKQQQDQRWYDITHHINGYESSDDWLDSIMSPVLDNVLKYGPAVYLAAVGLDASGLLGGLGEAAGSASSAVTGGSIGSAGADVALGSLPIDSSIGGLGWMDGALGASATTSGATAAGGLGSVLGGVSIPESSLPALEMPTLNGLPAGAVSLPADGMATSASTGGLLSQITDVGKLGSGLGSLLSGAGQIGSAVADYHMNNADKDYYQGMLDKMMGMYQPGTPEATLMEQKLNAQDAAAGRNSQYGTRATNLAGMLAQQRANIMTSPAFNSMAQASRGHYDNSLNSLFGALGQASTAGSSINNLINTGTNLYNTGSNLWSSGSSYLSNLFGGS